MAYLFFWARDAQIGSVIYAGQVINIPASSGPGYYPPPPYYPPPSYGGAYVVQYGDTLRKVAARYGTTVADILSKIAVRFGTTVARLQYLNNIWNPNRIYAGQVLINAT
ncbi:MAG: LysM domain-containing protein [Anaerolineales bacterium]|nr:LysM domain-containing protein [Anaerolineales bacterium]